MEQQKIETIEQELWESIQHLSHADMSALLCMAFGAARAEKWLGNTPDFFYCLRFAIKERIANLHDCRTCAKIACHDEAQYGTTCDAWIEKANTPRAF